MSVKETTKKLGDAVASQQGSSNAGNDTTHIIDAPETIMVAVVRVRQMAVGNQSRALQSNVSRVEVPTARINARQFAN